MGSVIKSLKQPPSYKNTIRLEILERVTRPIFGYIDWIKRISIDDAWFEDHTADSNIAASTNDLPLWDTFKRSLQSGSESGGGCYTPESESCSSEDEYSSDDEQPLLHRAPLSGSPSVDTASQTSRRPDKARELKDEFRKRLRRSFPYCIIGASLYALWPLLQIGTPFTDERESNGWNLVTKISCHEVHHLLAGLTLFACWSRYFFVRGPKSISQEAAANLTWLKGSAKNSCSGLVARSGKLFLFCQFWACAELGYRTLTDTYTFEPGHLISAKPQYYIYLFHIIGFLYGELLYTGLAISGLYIPDPKYQSNLTIWFPDVKQRLTVMGAMLGCLKGLFDITAYNRARPNVFEFEPWYDIYYACVKHVWIQASIQGFSMYLVCMIKQDSRKEEAEDLDSEDSQSEDLGNKDSESQCSGSEYSESEYSESEYSDSEDSLSESEGGVELMHSRLAKG